MLTLILAGHDVAGIVTKVGSEVTNFQNSK